MILGRNKIFPEMNVFEKKVFIVRKMMSSYYAGLSFQISLSPSSGIDTLTSEEDGSRCFLNDEKRGHGFITAHVHCNIKKNTYNMLYVNASNICLLLKAVLC